MNFLEVVLEIFSCIVRQIGVFPLSDVVFEDSLSVEDNYVKVIV